MLFKLALFLIASLMAFSHKTTNRDKPLSLPKHIVCNHSERLYLDSAIAELVGKRRFPQTDREYHAACNEALVYLRWSEQYINKCLSDFGKKAAGYILYASNNVARQLCKSGRIPKKGRQLMKAARCGNAMRPGIVKCVDRSTEALIGIAEKATDKMKIPLTCCNYYKLKECIISEAEEVKICTKKIIDTVEQFVTESFQGIIDLLCFEYTEDSDSCAKIIGKTPQRDKSKPLPKSPFLPAIQIITSIKDPEEL